MNPFWIVLSAVLFFVAPACWSQSAEEASARSAEQAGKLREALAEYTAALQKSAEGSTDEQRLSASIIALVKRMSPPLAIPDDARRYMGRGTAAVEIAKTPEDFGKAAAEFRKATRAAPWFANAYHDLGVVQEKAGLFDAAVRSYKLYLLAAPGARGAGDIEQRIFGLEYKAERQREQRQTDAQEAAARQEKSRASHADLTGYWRDSTGQKFLLKIDGDSYTMTRVMGCWRLPSQEWGQCPDLRPENTVWHFGQIADGAFRGFSFFIIAIPTRKVTNPDGSVVNCPVPAGNYPIYQGDVSADRKQLTIMARNSPLGDCPAFRFGTTYRRDD